MKKQRLKLGKLLEGVVGKKEKPLQEYCQGYSEVASENYGYNKAIDEISNLSVCIDEEKVAKIVEDILYNNPNWDSRNQYDEWIAKAISQSNCIVVRRA